MLKTELLEAIDQLPDHLQQEVLHFAQFLMSKYANGAVKEGAIESPPVKKRDFGALKGIFVLPLPDDFDEPLEDFKEYME
ncbi:MAG: DUF2281 domain-containing protein [Leptolyngbyaceae cyanobacterium SM1_3_5]|nr:DUF2281 domain-containing protein [Leptolyngbyaceae cyanobacterium SM1_3_5]